MLIAATVETQQGVLLASTLGIVLDHPEGTVKSPVEKVYVIPSGLLGCILDLLYTLIVAWFNPSSPCVPITLALVIVGSPEV